MTRSDEVRKLDKRTRNKVRAILGSDKNRIGEIAALKKSSGAKSFLIDEIFSHRTTSQILSRIRLFPSKPEFKDKIPAPVSRELFETVEELIEASSKNRIKLEECISSLKQCNKFITDSLYEEASKRILLHIKNHGWSHVILRKLALLRVKTGGKSEVVEGLLIQAGLQKNNIVVTSLIHCFAEEQNYLTTKKAVLNLTDRGLANAFTRNLARIPFQPIAINARDASALIQSSFNCSLIDGVVIAKINFQFIDAQQVSELTEWADLLEATSDMECIAKMHEIIDDETEYQFFKESSAWLELDGVATYRTLCDNFYDAVESSYINVTERVIEVIAEYVNEPSHSTLAGDTRLVLHQWPTLERIQNAGTVTRSAVFNYWLHNSKGEIDFNESQLLRLMSETRDLARTIPIEPARKAGLIASNRIVRLTMFLLLAKRSKNERDDSRLRDILQKIVIDSHGGSLINLVKFYENSHWAISDYIYDIATEDFIAKLLKITPDVFAITSSRAALHNWRAEKSGEKLYSDRARAILINYQLNKTRGEIDDNRIYVDANRFSTWINDEVLVELNGALTTSNADGKGFSSADEAVVKSVIERSYAAFCTHSTFGIASYLGRRIRHGTFKGQLFTSVINTAENLNWYFIVKNDANFMKAWNEWKSEYLKEVEGIVSRRLHVESKDRPEGFLKPRVEEGVKQDIQAVAARNIISVYEKTRTTDTLDVVITEYCWRMADIDLKATVAELKSWSNRVRGSERLLALASSVSQEKNMHTASRFTRGLLDILEAKMKTMLDWFKKPSNVSPRASVFDLYRAVADEVRDVFPNFQPGDGANIGKFDVIGSAYHNIYDCLYVILFNAAKHGDANSPLDFDFSVNDAEKKIAFKISSNLIPTQDALEVSQRIEAAQQADPSTAHLRDHRSGLLKLRQLEQDFDELSVDFIGVNDHKVVVSFTHSLAHLI